MPSTPAESALSSATSADRLAAEAAELKIESVLRLPRGREVLFSCALERAAEIDEAHHLGAAGELSLATIHLVIARYQAARWHAVYDHERQVLKLIEP